MALSPQGTILLSEYVNNAVKSVSPDKVVRTLFCTPNMQPWGLCILNSGVIAVSFPFKHKVNIYHQSGEIIQAIDSDLLRCPNQMAQNQVNKDLYIYDYCNGIGVFSSGRILALDKSFQISV